MKDRTKEELIRIYRKDMNIRKMWMKRNKHTISVIYFRKEYKKLREKLQELESK
ncbi:MAG: hypothetical protein IJ890_05735 [Clostridia bacterium]|nr:hypothetical protein [Clostridia bacterium]